MKRLYADYAAATPTDPRVIQRVSQVSAELIGNPSSLHQFGRDAETLLNQCRSQVADFLGAQADEIYFTGSGTESNNLAILGYARANKNRGNHIVTTSTEHPSVLNACRALERDGFDVTYLPVDRNGVILVEDFMKALTTKTVLATIHLANSELGVVQAIAQLGEAAKQHKVTFHTDACQAASYIDLNVDSLNVDMLTFNGSKLFGPRGVAALYVRDNVSLFPLVYGGGQEGSLRSGTENLPGIAGLALACQLAKQKRASDSEEVARLRDSLQKDLEAIGAITNCKKGNRLPNHLSVTIPTKQNDLVAALDRLGISVSSGSACSSRSQSDSHVLQAIGLTGEQINKTLRISLGRGLTLRDVQKITTAVAALVD